jgi:glycine/serine hydroxymethyltransferase
MQEPEMETIAELIDHVLMAPEDASVHARVKQRVRQLTEEFPLYPVEDRAAAG